MSQGHRFENAVDAYRFILGGNARVTLVSQATGNRFTYRVRQTPDVKTRYFVSLLTGTDNESNYSYIGLLELSAFRTTTKSAVASNAPSAEAFRWTLLKLALGVLPSNLEIWQEGKCGRCSRALTVPASIQTGFGPECAEIMGVEYAA